MAWEAWVALHLLTAWCMPALLRALSPAPLAARLMNAQQEAGEGQQPARLLQQVGLPVYHTVMAVVAPLAIGYAPFSGRINPAHAWRSLLASL